MGLVIQYVPDGCLNAQIGVSVTWRSGQVYNRQMFAPEIVDESGSWPNNERCTGYQQQIRFLDCLKRS